MWNVTKDKPPLTTIAGIFILSNVWNRGSHAFKDVPK